MARERNMGAEGQPLTLTVCETAELLRLSRNKTYDLIRAGAIPCLRLGRRLLVPRVALDRLLAEAGKPREGSR